MEHSSGLILGMGLSVCASVFWTITPLFFASAGRRIGAGYVNVIRLAMASVLLGAISSIYVLFNGGLGLFFMPWHGFFWFVLSGFFGLVAGDFFYLRALTVLGPRQTTQLFTLSPIVPAIIAWTLLGEHLSLFVLLGIAMIIAGIAWAVKHGNNQENRNNAEPGRFSLKGLLLAAIGTLFHGCGAVMARQAFLSAPAVDPLIATTVRVVSAGAVLAVITCCSGKAAETLRRFGRPGVPLRMAIGSLCGPVTGMIFYVSAFKFAAVGVVTTLSTLSPIFILPVIAIRYRVRIEREAIAGTLVALCGVAIMALSK